MHYRPGAHPTVSFQPLIDEAPLLKIHSFGIIFVCGRLETIMPSSSLISNSSP